MNRATIGRPRLSSEKAHARSHATRIACLVLMPQVTCTTIIQLPERIRASEPASAADPASGTCGSGIGRAHSHRSIPTRPLDDISPVKRTILVHQSNRVIASKCRWKGPIYTRLSPTVRVVRHTVPQCAGPPQGNPPRAVGEIGSGQASAKVRGTLQVRSRLRSLSTGRSRVHQPAVINCRWPARCCSAG